MSEAGQAPRRYLRLIILLVIAGEACRLRQYFSMPAFWEDEVAVLLNTRQQPMSRLAFVRLLADNPQTPVAAPPVFLWLTKWMGDRFDYHEWSVRLLPLLCSLAALALFARLAWRLVDPLAAVWAVALMAFSDPLIFQAANVKPYSGDVLAAILIVWSAFPGQEGVSPIYRLLRASLIATVALWISYSAVFVLAAVGLSLWPVLAPGRWRGLMRMLLCASPAIASFLLVYLLSIRQQRDVHLDAYWVHLFPNWLHPASIPAFFIGGTWEMFHYMFYPIGPIMLAAAIVAIVVLCRQNQSQLLGLLLAPVGLDILASCIAQYPYGGTRLTLFLLPFISLLCGIGAAAVANRWAQLALAAVPISAAALAVYGLILPQNKGNLRDALQFLNAHRQSGQIVYLVGNQTLGAARWYLPHPDASTHFVYQQTTTIPGRDFWMVICYEPRKYADNQSAMKQPNAVVDESRSFHTNGADVLWFAAKP